MGFLRKYIFPILFGVIFFSLFKNHLPKFKVLRTCLVCCNEREVD